MNNPLSKLGAFSSVCTMYIGTVSVCSLLLPILCYCTSIYFVVGFVLIVGVPLMISSTYGLLGMSRCNEEFKLLVTLDFI